MKSASLAILVLCSLITTGFKLPENREQYAQFRPQMRGLYQTLTQVMNFLVKDVDALEKKDREEIAGQLKALADQASAIKPLAKQSDKGHQVLAEELEKNARLAHVAFKEGRVAQARYFVSDVVNTCFSCHTSRSSPGDSRFVLNLNKDIPWNDFEPLAKARFLSLSRQFEESAREYEKLLLNDKLSTDQMINFDPVVEYMILNIRVRDQSAAVLKTLQAMKITNLPEIVKRDLSSWMNTLKDYQKKLPTGTPLEQSKKMLKSAREAMEFPRDRSGLVHFIYASKILHNFIGSEGVSTAEKAEAYYELGLCELILGTHLFADESSAYFEETIHLQPKTELARKAFAMFEENLLFGYSGSSGVHLPAEEKQRIDNLRKLAF